MSSLVFIDGTGKVVYAGPLTFQDAEYDNVTAVATGTDYSGPPSTVLIPEAS